VRSSFEFGGSKTFSILSRAYSFEFGFFFTILADFTENIDFILFPEI